MADDTATQLAEMKKILEDRLANDAVREKAFEALYEELRQYKEDWLFQAEKPLILDLLLFHDSLQWFQESIVKQEMSADVIADSFQYLVDEFLETLYRRDVIPIDAGETLDRKLHKVVKVEDTDDADLDQKVAQVLKRGFARGERMLRPEEVVINRARKK